WCLLCISLPDLDSGLSSGSVHLLTNCTVGLQQHQGCHSLTSWDFAHLHSKPSHHRHPRSQGGRPHPHVMMLHKEFETFELSFRELFMLQSVYRVHGEVIQGANSLPAGSAAFSVPPLFPGQRGCSRAAPPACELTSTARETCLALAMPWCYLLNTCGQDLSLNREIIQLLKGLGARTSHPGEQFYSSFYFMLWTFVCKTPPARKPGHLFWYIAITWLFVGFMLQDQHVLHLLVWPRDTNTCEWFGTEAVSGENNCSGYSGVCPPANTSAGHQQFMPYSSRKIKITRSNSSTSHSETPTCFYKGDQCFYFQFTEAGRKG
uniref:Uncharacterized protein n=1 Tax=Cyanistes caeruleus TaxID=156563 RepID=A0A8C0TZF1_CYACU